MFVPGGRQRRRSDGCYGEDCTKLSQV